MTRERNIYEFDRDIAQNGGYLYTTLDAPLSSRLSNRRTSVAILKFVQPKGKTIIDVGCGDGTYTAEFALVGASRVVGTDAASNSIAHARERFSEIANLQFQVSDVYELTAASPRFDIAVVRGLLHHLYDPEKAIQTISTLAREVIVLEPNGYNPLLKLIERFSPYHRRHEERSYPPHRLDGWLQRAGGRLVESRYIGLVPFFCPDLLARALKRLEPWIERMPVVRAFSCGQYLLRVHFD